jgi:hypothetical protein
MTSFIYPIIVGLVAFAGLSATCWLYDRWKRTIGGMYDGGASVIADQGDDWAPFPVDWIGSKPGRAAVWVIPPRHRMIEIVVDGSRPAWHSAVGVEIATRGE